MLPSFNHTSIFLPILLFAEQDRHLEVVTSYRCAASIAGLFPARFLLTLPLILRLHFYPHQSDASIHS